MDNLLDGYNNQYKTRIAITSSWHLLANPLLLCLKSGHHEHVQHASHSGAFPHLLQRPRAAGLLPTLLITTALLTAVATQCMYLLTAVL